MMIFMGFHHHHRFLQTSQLVRRNSLKNRLAEPRGLEVSCLGMQPNPTKHVGMNEVGFPHSEGICLERSELTAQELNQELDRWVDQSTANGTLFHTQQFLKYHPHDRFRITFLRFYENTHQKPTLGLLPCTIEGGTLKSPVGASYGGIAYDRKLPLRKIHGIIQKLLEWCSQNGIKEIKFTQSPSIYVEHASQDLDFALLYNGFRVTNALVSSAIDLRAMRSLPDPLNGFSADARYSVRLSKRSQVEIRMNDDLEQFYDILTENKAKFETKPAHTLEELKLLSRLCPDKFQLFSAWHQNEMACGIYTFHCNPRVLLIFYIASRPHLQKFGAVQRCLFEVMQWAIQKNYDYVDIGVSANTFSENPMEPSWSLVFFKEQTGARGYLRTTYKWNQE